MNSEPTRKLVLAGGSGFLGSALAEYFSRRGWQIVILTRKSSALAEASDQKIQEVRWDGKILGDWRKALNGCDTLINLAGRSINCRFTPAHRQEILDSRTEATKVLGQAISECDNPASVWLNCSGVGIYNQSFHRDVDESDSDFSEAETGASFMGSVALRWEQVLAEANTPRTRKVALRISLVLGRHEGSAFTILRRLARLGLAGRMGSGKQFVSWIHERDFCRAIEWIIQTETLSGPVNITAPVPVTNAEFMRSLRRASGRPIGVPAPALALKLGSIITHTEPGLVLDSRRVVPKRLMASGFSFDFPTYDSALRDLISPPR